MKVEFEWKRFSDENPQVGVTIIYKVVDSLYIGEFFGAVDIVDIKGKANRFIGNKLRLKSLSKKNTQTFDIPESVCGGFEWDYYNSEWV